MTRARFQAVVLEIVEFDKGGAINQPSHESMQNPHQNKTVPLTHPMARQRLAHQAVIPKITQADKDTPYQSPQ
jgi:hypothetical protein